MLGLLLVIGYIQAQSSVLSPSYDATTSHYRLQRNTNQRIRSKNHILHLKPSLKVKAAHHDNDYSLNEDEDLNPRQMNDVLEQLSTNDLDNIGFVEDPAEEYESGSGIEKRVEEYESWSASEKMDYLVNQINSDHNTLPIYGVLDTLGLFTESMAPTFAKTPDIMTKDRKKLIHTQGTIIKARYIPEEGNPYTGIFKSGSEEMLVRFSYATKPTPWRGDGSTYKSVPAVSMKFLRDGVPSANVFAMYSVDGQNDIDFFENILSNHVPNAAQFATKLLSKKFHQFSPFEGMLGLKDVAEYDSYGNVQEDPRFPFQLFFVPSEMVTSVGLDQIPPRPRFRKPENRLLYDVYALKDPLSFESSAYNAHLVLDNWAEKIGRIEATEDAAVSSYFGDRDLFFRHEQMEKDFEMRPEWLKVVQKWSGEKKNCFGKKSSKCPLGF